MKPALFLLFTFLTSLALPAQSPHFSIFDAIEQNSRQGRGVIVIHQSQAIKSLIGTRLDSENIEVIEGKSLLKTMGYRIQLYSGNQQRTSKIEVESYASKVKELFPEIETKIDFGAPWWRLYVGSYLTHTEAFKMQMVLRNAFPQLKKEITIIEDTISLPMD